MTDDMELLNDYAAQNSEAAFAKIVARHLNLVYSVALRHVGNPHEAEEITQAVFVILARKAGALRKGTVLSAWLFHTARLTAANFLRSEIRRARREQEAFMQSQMPDHEPDEAWRQMSPLLDEAIASLGEADRSAVVLRFVEGREFKDVGAALGATEDSVRMRVKRALEKLRKFFAKRGVMLTAAAIAGALSANAVQAAPTALAAAVTTVAAAKGISVSIPTATFIKGTIKLMAWTKLKTTVAVSVAVLLTAGTGAVFIQKVRHSSAGILWAVKHESLDHEPEIVFIRPAENASPGQNNNPATWGGGPPPPPAQALAGNGNAAVGARGPNFSSQVTPMVGGGGGGARGGGGGMSSGAGGSTTFSDRSWPGGGMTMKDNKMLAMGVDLTTLLVFAYDFRGPQDRVILLADMPTEKYDVLVGLPEGGREELQKQLKEKFGLTARLEQRDLDRLALTVKTPGSRGLKPHDGNGGHSDSMTSSTEMKMSATGVRMAMLVRQFSNQLRQPVVDQTGLRGTFDFELAVPLPVTLESANQALREQLGLELVPADKESVDYLIVEKNP
jgi:uncharacterized protein (TIGR03435 family)